jgi:hypothetical protein
VGAPAFDESRVFRRADCRITLGRISAVRCVEDVRRFGELYWLGGESCRSPGNRKGLPTDSCRPEKGAVRVVARPVCDDRKRVDERQELTAARWWVILGIVVTIGVGVHYATDSNARFCITHTCVGDFGSSSGSRLWFSN